MKQESFLRLDKECARTEKLWNFKVFGISTSIGKEEAKDKELQEVTGRPGKAGDTGFMEEREEGRSLIQCSVVTPMSGMGASGRDTQKERDILNCRAETNTKHKAIIIQ